MGGNGSLLPVQDAAPRACVSAALMTAAGLRQPRGGMAWAERYPDCREDAHRLRRARVRRPGPVVVHGTRRRLPEQPCRGAGGCGGHPLIRAWGLRLINAGPPAGIPPLLGFSDGSWLHCSDAVLSTGPRIAPWHSIDVEPDGTAIVLGALGDQDRASVLGLR